MSTPEVWPDLERWPSRGAALLISVAVIPLLIACVYGRVLFAPFFFDDAHTVLLNPTVQTPSSVRIMLAGTRPLLNLSYYGTFLLSGRSPWGHRLGNILLHAANAILLYVWLRLTLGICGAGVAARHWLAWLGSTCFAAHPLQTEAVTYISGRADVLVTVFALLAVTSFAFAFRARTQSALSIGWLAVTVLAAVAAVASKEIGVAVPIILLAYATVLSGGVRAALRAHWIMFAFLAVPWVVTAMLLASHPEFIQTAGFTFGSSEYGIPPLHYFFTQAGVVLHYFRLVLLPYGQVFDYDWPIVTSAAGAAAPASLLVAGTALAMLAGRRSWLYPFAVLWIFASLAPTSSIIPIADVIAERRMYLPLVGITLLMVLVVADVTRVLQRRQIDPVWMVAVSCSAVLLLAGASWARNGVWMDPLTLWQDTVGKQPSNPRAHTNLGIRYLERGNLHNARIELETALDLIAADDSAHATPRHGAFAATHLTLAYLELGDPVAAREAHDIALELGAQSYRELAEPLQRGARILAAVGQGDPDAQ